ncbi:MAG: thiamine-phosphate kinase [Microbacteriaceae bacterium]
MNNSTQTPQNDDMLTVGELGENEVLRRIIPLLPKASAAELGPGDDAAILSVPSGKLVLTTDTMLHGPDFRLAWSSGFDLGFKAAVSNLADVVAMGARPTGLLIALGCPDNTTVDFLQDFGRGISAAIAELAPGCGVLGGDLTNSETFTIAITAMGELIGAPVLRSGAQVGDTLAVAGVLGHASAGISMLFHRGVDADGKPDAERAAVLKEDFPLVLSAQLRPQPPFAAVLAVCEPDAPLRPNAMLDLSDGLLKDALRISRASSVALRLDPEQIRHEASLLAELVPEFADYAEGIVLGGGEDHSLLATFPAGNLPAGFRAIGTVTEGSGVFLGEKAVAEIGWDAFTQWDGDLG